MATVNRHLNHSMLVLRAQDTSETGASGLITLLSGEELDLPVNARLALSWHWILCPTGPDKYIIEQGKKNVFPIVLS